MADVPATKPAPKYVKGRLQAKLAFWQLFCKSTVVLSWITVGYEISWLLGVTTPPLSFPNAAGALQRVAFVTAEIADLLARGSIMQTHLPPAVVSPLNVIERRGKLRLILDLVYVNRFIDKTGLVAALMSRCLKREDNDCAGEPESLSAQVGAGPPPYLTPSA